MSTSFQQALRIRKAAKKAALKFSDCGGLDGDSDLYKKAYEATIQKEYLELEEVFKIKQEIENIHDKIVGKTCINYFFISVRPKPETTLPTFVSTIEKYLNRKDIIYYKISLEQKCVKGSGEGFHMHAIINAKWRSKGECLRNTQSTFSKIAADNCIDVESTRNPQEMFKNYCINYKANDNHKIITQEGDAIWRANNNIKPYYESDGERFNALSIKSNKTEHKNITPFIIELE